MSVFRRMRSTAAALRLQVAFRSSDPRALDVAIESLQRAYANAPPGTAAHLIAVRSLANALFLRAAATTSMDDLTAAQPVVDAAMATTPPGHQFRPSMLVVSAGLASVRSLVLADGEAATSAIEWATEALETAPGRWTKRGECTNILGGAHLLRFLADHRREDLQLAIDRLTDFLRDNPQHPERSKALNNLSTAYSEMYELTGASELLDQGLASAMASTEISSPANMSEPVLNVARMLTRRYQVRGDEDDLAAADQLIRSVEDGETEGIDRRAALRLAHHAGALAADAADEAAMVRAIAHLEQVLAILDMDDPESALQLANLGGVMSNLAHHRGDAAALDQALELLKRVQPSQQSRGGQSALCARNIGQTYVWRYEMHRRPTDLAESRRHFALGCDLASKTSIDVAIDCSSSWLRFERFDLTDEEPSLGPPARATIDACTAALAAQSSMATYRERIERIGYTILEAFSALVELGDVDEAVQAIELFRTLRLRRDFDRTDVPDALVAGGQQPRHPNVAYVWPSAKGGHLVVRRGAADLVSTALEGFTLSAVSLQIDELYSAYQGYRSAPPDRRRAARDAWEAKLRDCSVWVGTNAGRSLAELDTATVALVPLGLGSALPWPASTMDGGWLVDSVRLEFPISGEGLGINRVEAPLRALVTAAGHDDPRNPIPYADVERGVVSSFFSTVVDSSQPEEVVALLSSAAVAHLSCHGHLDVEDPARSALDLGGGFQLSALQIARLDLHQLRLVYLSACESSATRILSGDAPEGLAHSFLAAGAGCVIGSSWLVDDACSMVLALQFYEKWTAGRSASEALHAAQAWVRTATGEDVARSLEGRLSADDALLVAARSRADDRLWASPRYWASLRIVGEQDVSMTSSGTL